MKSFLSLSKIFALSLMVGVFLSSSSHAQDTFPLWEEGQKPYYKENSLKEYEKEAWGTIIATDITEPTLSIYRAQGKNSGKSVIIIPGGGYEVVAIKHEGAEIADVLAAQGITAAVLKYRTPNPKSSDQPHKVPLADARRAMQLLRSKADKYSLDINKVGVMGFSAGSHLATVSSLWKSEHADENPNFAALIYGVTNLNEGNQEWLENNLYHRKMTANEVEQNTLLNLVSAETPPTFLVHAMDDPMCHITETTLYAQKLFEHKVPTEMHVFPSGGHGFGPGKGVENQWLQLFINWVKSEQL